MPRIARVLIPFGAGLIFACSESPVGTNPRAEANLVSPAASPNVPGTYDFDFLSSGVPVTSLPFGSPVTLFAHVQGPDGPAVGGSVVFQYCSRKGFPPNNINRIDEAPLQVCNDGDGTWDNLVVATTDASGNATHVFCCPQVTPLIGFRYRFLARRSGVLGHTVEPRNFQWF